MENTAPSSTDDRYQDDDLAYNRRFLRGTRNRPSKPIPDVMREMDSLKRALVEDAKLPPAPRYQWKGGA